MRKLKIKQFLILILCLIMVLPVFACSKLADMEDGEDQVKDAEKVAKDYVQYVLDRDSESAKALTQERRGRDNDVLGDIFENMPYEQSNIVNKVFNNAEFEIVDMQVFQDDGSAQGTLVLTIPDLQALLKTDTEFTQVSFLSAIDYAPKTEKHITMKLVYVDEIYSVSTETVETIAKYILSLGYGDEYNFSLLNDSSALKCLQQYIYYSEMGESEEIIAMTDNAISWPSDYINNKYVNKFRQTYFSMMDISYSVIERSPDQYVVIKCTGYVPDLTTAGKTFMEGDYLVQFYGGYVYDCYYGKLNQGEGLEVQIFYTVFNDLIQDLPMVETSFEVTIGIVDDRVTPVEINGLEPDLFDYVQINELDMETKIDLMFKGTDYLYESKLITDSYHDYWVELIEEYRKEELGY